MMAAKRKREVRRNRRVDLFILSVLVAYMFLLPAWDRFRETRTYRDLAGITPFSGVYVTSSKVSEQGLIVSGYLVKERCVFDSLSGYVTMTDGRRLRVIVDDDREEEVTGGGSRPVSNIPEPWGPWVILPHPLVDGQVQWWEIYAHHIDCPSDPVVQNNLFAEGPWADYILVEE